MKKLVIILAMIVILLPGCSSEVKTNNFINQEISKAKAEVALLPEDWENIIGLNLSNGYSDTENGVVFMNKSEDPLYIILNSAQNEASNYILKIFLNYEEVDFTIEGQIYSSYTFNLEHEEAEVISFNLASDKLNLDSSQIVSIAVFQNPEKKSISGEFSKKHMCLDFEVCKSDASRTINMVEDIEFNETEQSLMEIQYSGIMLNEDYEFKDSYDVKLPGEKIEASTGEKVTLAYRVGNLPNMDEIAFCVMVDWKQVDINGEKYKRVINKEGKITGGVIEFIAPMDPGEYEVIGMVFQYPFKLRDETTFDLNEVSPRFTLVVK